MSVERMQIEDLLQELRHEGRLDSCGQFTLDRRRASPKLQRYLLRNPYHYALKLVQAGVAASATSIDFRIDSWSCRIHLEGMHISLDEPEQLLLYLLESPESESSALRHLAMALNGMVGMGARSLGLQSWDGVRGSRWSWQRGQIQAQSLRRGGSTPWLKLEFKRAARTGAESLWRRWNHRITSLLEGRREALELEHATLVDRARFCPIPITINGQPLERRAQGGPESCIDLNKWGRTLVQGLPHDLSASQGSHPLSLLTVLERGVLLNERPVYAGSRAYHLVLLDGQKLTRDLTGLEFVADSNFYAYLSDLIHGINEGAGAVEDPLRQVIVGV